MINANAVNINMQHQDAHSDVKHTFACRQCMSERGTANLEMMQKLLEVLGRLQKLQQQLSVCREARFLWTSSALASSQRLLSAHGIIGNVRESISNRFSDL